MLPATIKNTSQAFQEIRHMAMHTLDLDTLILDNCGAPVRPRTLSDPVKLLGVSK